MTKYIKNFVTGHGVTFETSKRNHECFEKAATKWKEIGSDLQINQESVILFCGGKNNGKSLLLRYLINKYNHDEGHNNDNHNDHAIQDIDNMRSIKEESDQSNIVEKYAYYVDYDPGQAEMTTPGVVSAHIIRSSAQPLQSPAYLNVLQHEPVAMSCVGGTNMSVNPRMFIENCRYIFNQVKDHQSRQPTGQKRPIFINTMGYIRNVGLAMLMDLIKICKPTNLVVLNIEGDPMRTIYADLSPNSMENTRTSFYYETSHDESRGGPLNYKYHLYNLGFSFVDSTSIATKNRIASQLAYFASIPAALYKPVMQLSSKWLSLKSVSIYCVSSYPLKVDIVLELLNHSWIHLVKLRKPQRWTRNVTCSDKVNSEEMVCNVIDDVGENNMFGCGIVTDIDSDERRLAIITPLSQATLDQDINCVIKPLSIQVPREMIQASV